MTGVRHDIQKGIDESMEKTGSPWSEELLWYARAVKAMQARPITDPTSWAYCAALHGISESIWIDDGITTRADLRALGSDYKAAMRQCQHGTWFFLPWHRGYLAAFEAIVTNTIVSLGGPTDWTVPYWNYLYTQRPGSNALPAPFVASTWPDGGKNPLGAVPRRSTGPLPVGTGELEINLNCQKETIYTSAPNTRHYGGAKTPFMHRSRGQSGANELNPHNTVHNRIGGYIGNQDTAALDPIFWVHHCNIDRLWAAWMTDPGHVMENGADFRNGPLPDRYQMPDISQSGAPLKVFTPGDTLPGNPLDPTYDDLYNGTGIAPPAPATRLTATARETAPMPKATFTAITPRQANLIGANDAGLTVTAAAVSTAVSVDEAPEANSGAGLRATGPGSVRRFLNIEQIKGSTPSGTLNVYLKNAAGAYEFLETLSLFGLAQASSDDDPHGGNGMNVAIDVTRQLDDMMTGAEGTPETLDVRIEQITAEGEEAAPITVGRVSLYEQPTD